MPKATLCIGAFLVGLGIAWHLAMNAAAAKDVANLRSELPF